MTQTLPQNESGYPTIHKSSTKAGIQPYMNDYDALCRDFNWETMGRELGLPRANGVNKATICIDGHSPEVNFRVAAGLRARSSLAPMIVAPLAIPLLIGGSQALESLGRGTGILPWVLLVTATDLALAVTSALIARPLEEASR